MISDLRIRRPVKRYRVLLAALSNLTDKSINFCTVLAAVACRELTAVSGSRQLRVVVLVIVYHIPMNKVVLMHLVQRLFPPEWSVFQTFYFATLRQRVKAQIPLRRLPRDVRDKPVTSVPFSPNSITPTFPKLPVRRSFGEVGVMEFGLKSTSQFCRGLVADVTDKSA